MVGWRPEHAVAVQEEVHEWRTRDAKQRRKGPPEVAWLIAGLIMFMVAIAAGCGGDDDDGGSEARSSARSARPRARSNLLGWAGYVEDGSTDPKVDWVTDFEKETGCQTSTSRSSERPTRRWS